MVWRQTGAWYFYPRPPRGGRPARRRSSTDWRLFLSTPSARRATPGAESGHAGSTISIHALREEGDIPAARRGSMRINFYPRPPRGGRRPGRKRSRHPASISIHALREEGDGIYSSISPG